MDSLIELARMIEEFGTSVFRFNVLVGIAVMIAVFALEVKWTRSHTPNDKKVEEALKLGHVIEAKRVHFWDDGVAPDERSTS